jgi:outer membrane lipoprotein-sorting protein
MSKFIFSSLILTTFLIFNCAPKPKILPEERTQQNILKCAVRNQVKFETFACILNLKLKGEKAKFSSTIEFFYKSPDLFSFYPQSFWGTNIFKAKGEGDSLTLYFPHDNEFYKGNFSDFEKSELWNLKIDLKTLLKIITGEDDLSEKDVLYAGQERNKFIYKSEDERWTKEYWIDFKKCRLTRSVWTDKKKGEVYEIEYKNFSSYQNVGLANVIEIKSTAKGANHTVHTKESAKIKFIERKFNLLIPEKKFQLEIPPDAKRITFEPNM